VSSSTKATRSLAASKANVTRKARKAALKTATTQQLERELLVRALDRAAFAIFQAKIAVEKMEAKQARRIAELRRIDSGKKGGAS